MPDWDASEVKASILVRGQCLDERRFGTVAYWPAVLVQPELYIVPRYPMPQPAWIRAVAQQRPVIRHTDDPPAQPGDLVKIPVRQGTRSRFLRLKQQGTCDDDSVKRCTPHLQQRTTVVEDLAG